MLLSKKLQHIYDYTYNKCITNENFITKKNKSMHCATIFSGNKVLSCACNDNTRTKGFGMCIMSEHAECGAIRNLVNKRAKHYPHILSGKKYKSYNKKIKSNKLCMLVLRINKHNEIKNSKCCIVCLSVMKAYNIKVIYYSTDDGEIIKEKVKEMKSDFLTTGFTKISDIEKISNIVFIIIGDLEKELKELIQSNFIGEVRENKIKN